MMTLEEIAMFIAEDPSGDCKGAMKYIEASKYSITEVIEALWHYGSSAIDDYLVKNKISVYGADDAWMFEESFVYCDSCNRKCEYKDAVISAKKKAEG